MGSTCPCCGADDALVDIGARIDHPRRWLRWSTTITHIFTCTFCGEIVEVADAPERHNGK